MCFLHARPLLQVAVKCSASTGLNATLLFRLLSGRVLSLSHSPIAYPIDPFTNAQTQKRKWFNKKHLRSFQNVSFCIEENSRCCVNGTLAILLYRFAHCIWSRVRGEFLGKGFCDYKSFLWKVALRIRGVARTPELPHHRLFPLLLAYENETNA